MNGCELCDRVARMYCESDQASLCWDCDAKVHGANFLVARHARVLLCRSCQAPTPWKASGARLNPTVSVCESCYVCEKASCVEGEDSTGESGDERMEENGEDYYEDDASDTNDEDEDEDEEEDEEEGENQVVPWSPTSPPPASSSSGESSSTGMFGADLLKRMRENADLAFQHDDTSSSSRWDHLVAASPQQISLSTRSTACASYSYSSKDHHNLLRLEATPLAAATDVSGNHMSIRRGHSTVNLVSSSSRRLPI